MTLSPKPYCAMVPKIVSSLILSRFGGYILNNMFWLNKDFFNNLFSFLPSFIFLEHKRSEPGLVTNTSEENTALLWALPEHL